MNKGSSSYANLYKKKHETVKCRQEIPCQEKSIVSNEKKVNFDQLKDWDEFPNSNPKVVINEIDDNDNNNYSVNTSLFTNKNELNNNLDNINITNINICNI